MRRRLEIYLWGEAVLAPLIPRKAIRHQELSLSQNPNPFFSSIRDQIPRPHNLYQMEKFMSIRSMAPKIESLHSFNTWSLEMIWFKYENQNRFVDLSNCILGWLCNFFHQALCYWGFVFFEDSSCLVKQLSSLPKWCLCPYLLCTFCYFHCLVDLFLWTSCLKRITHLIRKQNLSKN